MARYVYFKDLVALYEHLAIIFHYIHKILAALFPYPAFILADLEFQFKCYKLVNVITN